jgi:hypothetical protein
MKNLPLNRTSQRSRRRKAKKASFLSPYSTFSTSRLNISSSGFDSAAHNLNDVATLGGVLKKHP